MRRLIIASVALAACLGADGRLLPAGTIRHDRNDQLYRSAARNPKLDAVVMLLVDGSRSCSGTLIAPQWVLTATHCIWPDAETLEPRQSVVVKGQRFDVGPDDIFINPEWLAGGFDVLSTRGDIALIRLPRPVIGVEPIALHRGAGEVGQWGYIAGFGSTGTGRTGNTLNTAVKRVGANVIDATVATISFPARYPHHGPVQVGSSRALLTDFDNAARNASTLGGTEPLNMEYTTAEGDSGGPLLLYRDEAFTVAGIASGGIDGFDGLTAQSSFYSDTATFTRVASYLGWIDRAMRGNAPSLRQYFRDPQEVAPAALEAAADRQRTRAAELRRVGWQIRVRGGRAGTGGGLPILHATAFATGIGPRHRPLAAELIEHVERVLAGHARAAAGPAQISGFDPGCDCE